VTGGLDISRNGQVYANLAEQVALEVAERFSLHLLGHLLGMARYLCNNA
jgi:hypothetical protein